MERAKADIDDVWKQLKRQQLGNRKVKDFEKLWNGFHNDACSNKVKSSPPDITDEVQCYLHLPARKQQLRHAPSAAVICDQVQQNQEDTSLDKLAELLQSTNPATRRDTLKRIKAYYTQEGSFITSRPVGSTPPAAAEAICSKLGKSLLKRFDDRIEHCRELAVSTFKQILEYGPDAILRVLPYAMPVLEERLHVDESAPAESSEEIRLLLVQLLCVILQQAGAAIAAYASEVWSIISAALADTYHEVALQGCKAAEQFSGTLGLRLGSLSKDIAVALLPLTTHTRHRVRIAAIKAIEVVMHQGAHEKILDMVAWRDPNLIPIRAFYGDDTKVNYCGKLATDHHVQVRLAFVHMVGNWMLTLRERNDHQSRLLPYLLNGLCDDSPVVMDTACQLLSKLGEQYEQEHEKDLEDLIRFGDAAAGQHEMKFLTAVEKGLVVYTPAGNRPAGTSHSASAGTEATSSTSASAVFQINGPFQSRPRLGSRVLVANNFSGSLCALCAELSSWQLGPRLMSAKLLRINVILVEAAAERHLQVLLTVLCTSIRSEDGGDVIADCAAVLGCHCDFGMILDLLGSRLSEAAEGEAKRQAEVLLVLAAILRGAGPLGRVQGHITQLLTLLSQPSIAASHDSNIKAAATAVMQQLLKPGIVEQLQLLIPDPAATEPQQQSGGDEAAVAVIGNSDKRSSNSVQPDCVLKGFVHLLLQLASSEVPCVWSAAGADSSPAVAEQEQRIGQLLGVLAGAAGCETADELLGICRKHLISKVSHNLFLDHWTPSSSSVSVLCRLMMPSSCHWVLTASHAATAFCRGPLSASTPAASKHGWLQDDGSSSSGFAEAAESYSLPDHLMVLLQVIDTAERHCSKHSHTPVSLHLLQLALDCCVAVWPSAAFDESVLQQLLQRTLPTLLQSSHGLAAMAGLRALHHLIKRGIVPRLAASADSSIVGDNVGSAQSDRQQQQEQCMCLTRLSATHLLATAWRQGLCEMVSGLIQSNVAAVRLEACYLVGAVLPILSASQTASQAAQQSVPSTAAAACCAAVQPVAALTAALQDADADVRAAASATLQELQNVNNLNF